MLTLRDLIYELMDMAEESNPEILDMDANGLHVFKTSDNPDGTSNYKVAIGDMIIDMNASDDSGDEEPAE